LKCFKCKKYKHCFVQDNFLFDPSKKLNWAAQWFELFKFQNTCEVFCLYSLRIGSPLLFLILSPHYLEQILWCYFSCQLLSFLFKTQSFWCMYVQKPFTCIVPTLALWITWFKKNPKKTQCWCILPHVWVLTLQNIESFLVKCK